MEKYGRQQAKIDKGKKSFIEIIKQGNEGHPLHHILSNLDDDDILTSVRNYLQQFKEDEF